MTEEKLHKISRTRSANWSQEMKELLRDLVTPYVHILDSKNNSASFISKKNNAWVAVEKKMHAAGYIITSKKLKEQWNRLKTQARSNISLFKHEQKATGGGDCPSEPNEFDYSIANIIPLDFEEDIAEFDSDALKDVNNSNDVEVQPHSSTTVLSENIFINLDAQTHETAPTEKLTAVSDVENQNPKQKIQKRRENYKRRRTGTAAVGDDMLNYRIKQIKTETQGSEALIELKLEIERAKLKNLQELHGKNMEIKNKELELLATKIENEKKPKN